MGRLGPLTSLALGRSPYDDVVAGEGENDPREPEKQYDATGRLINPETKRINRDIIRAHNEVMLVIGVAEPESSSGVNSVEAEAARNHHDYESDTGRKLLHVGRALNLLGAWGFQSIRQRVMIYQEPAGLPFLEMLHTQYAQRSYTNLCLGGLPGFATNLALLYLGRSLDRVHGSRLYQGILNYIRFHLRVYVTLQQLDLISPSRWLPDVGFFIPFTSSSPIAPPPPIEHLDVASISSWVGALAMNVAPYAALYLFFKASESFRMQIFRWIYRRLPSPTAHLVCTLPAPSNATPRQAIPESPTLGAADREIRHTQNPDMDEPTPLALDGQQPNGDGVQVGAVRRQSTFSSRGAEDYATDEEDSEVVNPTLISFDVDTSESAEPPPPQQQQQQGVWSAELRPSVNSEARHLAREPQYVVNPLTSLPAQLAGDVLTAVLGNLLTLPGDALARRGVARAFALRMGLMAQYNSMLDLTFPAFSVQGFLNAVLIELVRLLTAGEIWAVVTVVSQWLHVSEDEWRDMHRAEEEEAAAAVADAHAEAVAAAIAAGDADGEAS
ncbi:hypothetical protein F4780DRAFT_436912 [Xylariomycetidae sp. FL0641]|nr:hypothetical protein F4780DRAFT_436912 [Xylariomycetidae sp. FL0641]